MESITNLLSLSRHKAGKSVAVPLRGNGGLPRTMKTTGKWGKLVSPYCRGTTARSFLALTMATTLSVGGCTSSGLPAHELICGPGTHAFGNACLSDSPNGASCGPGTHLVGDECLPDPSDGGVPRDMANGGALVNDLAPDPLNADLAPIEQGNRAVSWQIDPAHSGGQPNTTLRPPLVRLWSYDTGGPVGYPIVSDGRVFITSGISGAAGARIAALDSETGNRSWGPISLGGAHVGGATASYDVTLARLFVMNGDGVVQAMNPVNGSELWSKQASTSGDQVGSLVSQSGLLFVPQQWNLAVWDGATGAPRWTGGEGASPMVTAVCPSAVYSCSVGGGVVASDPSSGAQLWVHMPNGDGGGGCFTVLGGNRVYAYDWADPPITLDPTIGNVEGGFTGPAAPAFDDERSYFLIGENLEAHDATSNAVLWSFAGDGTLDTQPIAGGGYVYVGGSSGMLYALDSNGQVVYSELLPSPLTPANNFLTGAPTGFAIAEDKLFISAGTTLYAYTNN